MKFAHIRLGVTVAAITALTAVTSIVIAQDGQKKQSPAPTKSTAPTATPPKVEPPVAPELPPGMTAADMEAMMIAATPGPMQHWLCEDAGTWEGACKMWIAPHTEPDQSKSSYTITPVLGGRFVRTDTKSDMGEWGMFEGQGVTGYDIAKGEFQSQWMDSMGTGMMFGTGSLSSDQKVLTINYSYFCSVQKKECAFKHTFTRNDNGSRTMRMWGPAMGTGEVFQIMETVYTRVAAQADAGAASTTSAASKG